MTTELFTFEQSGETVAVEGGAFDMIVEPFGSDGEWCVRDARTMEVLDVATSQEEAILQAMQVEA